MAQTGYTPILIYSSSTGGNTPAAGNLTNSTLGSELAINITDGKLFYKDNTNAVQVIGWKTTPTTAGGTGLTTYTAGDLSYYATGTTFTKLAIGTTGQILTSTGSAPQWTTLSGVAVTTFSAGTTGFTPNSATSGAVTLAGTLAVGNGGTGTATAFTAGSIVFAGASGVYSQDNAGLFWDDTNNRLGVGTNTPLQPLSIESASNIRALIRNTTETTAYSCSLDFVTGTGSLGSSNVVGRVIGLITQADPSTLQSALSFQTNAGDAVGERMRIAAAGDITATIGNFVVGTSGKGIDFSATAGTGTSELLADYEEGTWTPVDQSGASLSFTNAFGYYTKVGDTVTAWGRVTYPATASGLTAIVGGLPFTAANNNQPGGGFTRLTNSARSDTLSVGANTTQITFYSNLLEAPTNVRYTGARIDFVMVYKV